MVAEYLDKNYDRVWHIHDSFFCISFPIFGAKMKYFNSYTTLILSNNYVTKRQSLKLLGEILLDRANFNVMTRYIAQESNLKMMMNMLRDKSKNIQFEAFHVFKVRLCLIHRPMTIICIGLGLRGKPEKAAPNRGNITKK